MRPVAVGARGNPAPLPRLPMRRRALDALRRLWADPGSGEVRLLSLWALITLFILTALVVHEPKQPRPVSLLVTREPGGAEVCASLQWDVGAGFNEFEAKRVCLAPAPNTASTDHDAAASPPGYSQLAGSRAQAISLPQKRLLRLRLKSESGPLEVTEIAVTVQGAPRWSMSVDPTLSVIETPPGLAAALHQGALSWQLVLFQTIAAGLGGAALVGALIGIRLVRRSLRSTPLPALVLKHWPFWLIFVLCTAHYLLWVLGQWPGFPTPDTRSQLGQRVSLTFENTNPLVFTLLLNSVVELTGSLGFVTVAQAIATAALGAYGFAALKRDGCPGWMVLLFGLSFAASPVIAIYNLQPWRDIAFSLLVQWWTIFVFRRALAGQGDGAVPRDPRAIILALGALTFLVSTVRHNGLVFLIVIPALLAFGRITTRWVAVAVAGIAFLNTAIVYGPVALAFGVHRNTDYSTMRFALAANTVVGIMQSDSYHTPSPANDREIVSAVADFDALRRAYNPASALPLLGVPRKVPLNSPQVDAMVRLDRRLMFDNPHIFLAERTFLFLSALGFRNWGWGSVLWMPGRPERFVTDATSNLRRSPVTTAFDGWQSEVLSTIWHGPGWLNGYVLYFSAFVPFCLLLAVFALSRWLPATALASLIPLTQAAAIYLTIFTTDFRFVYFLYLYGFFALPMMVTEWRARAGSTALQPVSYVPESLRPMNRGFAR